MCQMLTIVVLCFSIVSGQDVTVSDSAATVMTTTAPVMAEATAGVVATPATPPPTPPPPQLMIFPNLNEWKSSFKERVDKLR